MNQIRISFSGTHCAGKTTAIYAVASELKKRGFESTQVVPEVARFCPFPINTESSFDTALWIITRQMLWEARLKNSEILLLDRCVLDEIAYALDAVYAEKMTCQEYAIVSGIARKWNEWRPIDLMLLFTPRTLIDDGVRKMDDEWQASIDRKIRGVVHRFHIKKGLRLEILNLDSIHQLTKECIRIVTDFIGDKKVKE